MRCHGVQILVTSLLSTSSAYILLDGYPGLRPNYRVDPLPPHPLSVPQPPLPPPLPPPPYFYRAPQPHIPWSPPVLPPPPVYLKGVFPPFIERIVQRIQTVWSFYNPPETLTRPPPYSYPTQSNSPKRKPSTTSSPTTVATTSTTTNPEDVPEDRIPTTATPAEDSNTSTDSDEIAMTTTTPTYVASEHGVSGVSTLAVFEVTPSSVMEVEVADTPAPEEASENTTPAPQDSDDDVTSAPQDFPMGVTLLPLDLAESDTEDTAFITPERASLLSHKDAYLRYLQTGKVPPYLESDRYNEMEDIFS